MIRIYIRKPGQNIGRVYKAKNSILTDKVAILAYIPFVISGLISEQEWASSQELITDKFNLYVYETPLDGRKKIARNIPYFNWKEVLTSNHQIKPNLGLEPKGITHPIITSSYIKPGSKFNPFK